MMLHHHCLIPEDPIAPARQAWYPPVSPPRPGLRGLWGPRALLPSLHRAPSPMYLFSNLLCPSTVVAPWPGCQSGLAPLSNPVFTGAGSVGSQDGVPGVLRSPEPHSSGHTRGGCSWALSGCPTLGEEGRGSCRRPPPGPLALSPLLRHPRCLGPSLSLLLKVQSEDQASPACQAPPCGERMCPWGEGRAQPPGLGWPEGP